MLKLKDIKDIVENTLVSVYGFHTLSRSKLQKQFINECAEAILQAQKTKKRKKNV